MSDVKKRRTSEKKANVTEPIKLKNIIKNYFTFYKQKIMRKHIIVYIICLIVFFIEIVSLTGKIDSLPNISELAQNAKEISENSQGLISLIFTNKIPLIFMIIFAGCAPYFFVPIIGIGSAYSFAIDIVTNFNVLTGKTSLVPMCIGVIIELIAVGLAVATGIEYCLLSTKKWRYSRNKDYSWIDFKRTFYEAVNNKKKLKEIEKKKIQKNKKNEKNNVKIPYLYLLISFVISSIIIIIGTIVAKI